MKVSGDLEGEEGVGVEVTGDSEGAEGTGTGWVS